MSLLKFPLLLQLLVLTIITIETEAQEPLLPHTICTNTTTFVRNSTYQTNLNSLLSSLSSNGTNNLGFYNASAGQEPNVVYGLYLCRGDVSASDCQTCVTSATETVVQYCPVQKVAVLYDDPCLLRYSNQYIFSSVSNQGRDTYSLLNTQDISGNQTSFDELVTTTMLEIASQASNVSSGAKKFAVKKVPIPGSQSLYTLAQCTPDLSSTDCDRCLQGAIGQLPDCCSGKRGGRVLMPSCNVRYEIYPFYNEAAVPPAPPPPVIPRPKGVGGSNLTGLKIGGSISSVIVIALLCYCTYTVWKRKLKRDEKDNIHEVQLLGFVDGNHNENIQGENPVESQNFPLIKLDVVHNATNHFSNENKLGEGGFGPVYKGTFEDGKEIAVKRLSRSSGQGLIEFMNEVTLIARLQHRNLVRLLGCCLEKNEKILIYEYMPNKSLDLFIFDSSMAVQLDWQRRLSIINGIARGLLYLHEDSRLKIIHRDLKTSNILLDYEMNPKISDFGMARIFGGKQNEANTNRIVGTYGYMSPEYAMEGLFSLKSDIFSFGVIVLEIISGKRNNGFHQSEQGESLLTYAWKLWSNMQALELMDPLIVKSSVATEVVKCIHIALLCVQDDPANRPIMSSVGVMLASDNISLPVPSQPALYARRAAARSSQSSDDKICSVNEVTMSNVSPR